MPGYAALNVLQQRLDQAENQGLTRRLTGMGPACKTRALVRGRDCLLMASNDYLGLAAHPAIIAAAQAALEQCGAGSGASRLISGTLEAHLALEEQIAAFKHCQASLFMPTGYHANLATLAGLAQPGDLILSDALNHASIIDGCRLSGAKVRVYPHGDVDSARRILAASKGQGLKILVTDGVFSMDGGLAPLPELLKLARRHQALLVIDEAHATGVYGGTGRGSLEHFGLEPGPEVVQVCTFGKGLGGLGGAVCASREVIDVLVNRARSFLFTTAAPPAQVAAASEALRLVDEEPWRREKLFGLCGLMRKLTGQAGLEVMSAEGPIIPILAGEAGAALELGPAALGAGGVRSGDPSAHSASRLQPFAHHS
jgi:8-amino-7-oxononanoate synthase